MKFKVYDLDPDKHVRVYTDPGSRFKPVYEASFLDDGSFELVKVREIDTHAFIQSLRPSCDMSIIIARYLSGDLSVDLHQREEMYLDLSDMPTTFAEWKNMEADLTQRFSELPLEEKEKYGNSALKYIFGLFNEQLEKNRTAAVADSLKAVENSVENPVEEGVENDG